MDGWIEGRIRMINGAEGWVKHNVCAQLVSKPAIFAFLSDFYIARISLVKNVKLLRNKNTDRTCTRGRDRVFLHTCKAVVTCNWSVCSCLCFSSSPLVSLSLASSSLDLISSDSWTGEGGGGKKGSKTRQNPSERQQLKKKCR